MARARILFACPRMSMRRDWCEILSQDPEFELVGEAEGSIEALLKAGNSGATVVVIDLPSSGRDPGLTDHILDEYPHIKVIAVSEDGRRAMKYETGIVKASLGDTSLICLKDMFRSVWLDS
ncbi:MAG: hypothetical protein OXN21_03325 [Chloroflexota bacterium]|nr:hypothetical protein [Chloroflexota bacterium]